jgi:hypothetical protein
MRWGIFFAARDVFLGELAENFVDRRVSGGDSGDILLWKAEFLKYTFRGEANEHSSDW